jgi:hypothetical protein
MPIAIQCNQRGRPADPEVRAGCLKPPRCFSPAPCRMRSRIIQLVPLIKLLRRSRSPSGPPWLRRLSRVISSEARTPGWSAQATMARQELRNPLLTLYKLINKVRRRHSGGKATSAAGAVVTQEELGQPRNFRGGPSPVGGGHTWSDADPNHARSALPGRGRFSHCLNIACVAPNQDTSVRGFAPGGSNPAWVMGSLVTGNPARGLTITTVIYSKRFLGCERPPYSSPTTR